MNTQNAIQELSEEIFSVVKEKVDAKVDKADIGYLEIDVTSAREEPPTITLTSSQLDEINKKYCIAKIIGGEVEYTLYKTLITDGGSTPLAFFYSLTSMVATPNVVSLGSLEMQVNTNTGVVTFIEHEEDHYTATGSDSKYQTKANLTTAWNVTTSDSRYPSEKLVKDGLDNERSWATNELSYKQSNITSSNKLSSDLVDDTSTTNKFVNAQEKKNIDHSLYNIGAYDTYSVSNGVVSVVRGTGYINLDDLTWTLRQGTGWWYYEASFKQNQYFVDNTTVSECKHTIYQATYVNDMGYSQNKVAFNDSVLLVKTTWYQASPDKPTGILQYKLNSTYTDTYIENTPNIALDQNGANWLRNEWEKGLNLFDVKILESGSIDSSTGADVVEASYCRTSGFIDVIPNQSYYYSKNTYNYGFYIYLYNNGTFVQFIDGSGIGGILNIPSNVNQIRFKFNGTINDLTSANIMLNKGTHAYPYQEHNGAIVHTKDIEPVLLWENSSPTSSMVAGTISGIKSMSDYKYLTIIFKRSTDSDQGYEINKCVIDINYTLAGHALVSGNYYRQFAITSSTGIYFGNGKNAGTNDDTVCIPYQIYGTNVL